MKIKCPECNGRGAVECGHASHWIDTMSYCTECENGWLECELCNGEGTIEDQTGKE